MNPGGRLLQRCARGARASCGSGATGDVCIVILHICLIFETPGRLSRSYPQADGQGGA